MSQRKQMMCGCGPVPDKDWNPKKFTYESALSYMNRTMPKELREHGFVSVVAEFGDYFRGSYAAMPVNVHTGRCGR